MCMIDLLYLCRYVGLIFLCDSQVGNVLSDSHLDFFAWSPVQNEVALAYPICDSVEPRIRFFKLSLLDHSID